MRYFPHAMTALALVCLTAGCTEPRPACPDWSNSAIHNYSNSDMSNYGCAYYNNLRAQVANPDDLEGGHGDSTTASGDRESAVIQKYNSATVQTPPAINPTSSTTR